MAEIGNAHSLTELQQAKQSLRIPKEYCRLNTDNATGSHGLMVACTGIRPTNFPRIIAGGTDDSAVRKASQNQFGFSEHLCLNPFEYLGRHKCGEWGDKLRSDDLKSNDEALVHGGRLLSSYMVKGIKVWIITEWNRSATTPLLPSEY